MTKRLLRVTLTAPAVSGDVPAVGHVVAKPTLRRHLETPTDHFAIAAEMTSVLGEALTYVDNESVEQTVAATPGVAWFWLDVTDEGDYADLWAWTFSERTDAPVRRTIQIPTGLGVLEYADQDDLDPEDFSVVHEPKPGWLAALTAEIDRATDEEAALAQDITDEVLRAQGKEDALDDRIDAEIANRGTAIAAEVSARNTAIADAIAALVDSSPGTLNTLKELADALGDDPNFAATISTQLGLKASLIQLAAEATLARNGDNITSGTIADARIASTITRDSEVSALVAAELAGYQPGLEIGYAERATPFTSTQVAANAAGAITSLSITVVGTGRAVDVRFACPAVWAATANKQILATLGVTGTYGGVTGVRYSPATTFGPSLEFTRRLVLTAGVSYTFTVAVYGEATSGTVTAWASATFPTTLSVTNR